MRNWDELASPEEKAKVKKFRRAEQSKRLSSARLLALVARMWGWNAVRDVMLGKVDARLLLQMVEEGQRLERERIAQHHLTVYNAVACALSKNGNRQIDKIAGQIRKGK